MAATAALPDDAFATAEAGADYFTTDAHYQSLATRIHAVFRAGHSFVLVVKDTTMSAELLGRALAKLATPRHVVVEINARPETTCDEVLRAAPERVALPQRDSALIAAVPAAARQPAPLFLLNDADSLSYEKLEQIYDALQPDDLVTPAVVFVAQEEFVSRLDRPALRFLKEALSGQFRFTQLAREEVATYIHHQLRSAGTTNAFPADTIAAIADVAEGDASVVNRLARLVIDFAATSGNASAGPTLEIVEPSAPKEAQIHEFNPRVQEVSSKLFEPPTPQVEPTPLTPRPKAPRARAASILLKAFGEPGRPTATQPPLIEAGRGGSLRRAPVGILVALAYIGVVSAASIGLFWILHPTAKNFVSTGVQDINLAFDQLRGSLFLRKPPTPPIETAALPPPATATAPIPPAAPPALSVARAEPPLAASTPAPATDFSAPPVTAKAFIPPLSAAPAPPAPIADAPPPLSLPAKSPAAATPSMPSDLPAIASATPDSGLPASPRLTPLGAMDAVPMLSPDADDQSVASDLTTNDSLASQANRELDTVSPPPVPGADQANLSALTVPDAPAAASTESVATVGAPHLSADEIADLLKRGTDLVGVGDIISARLYFERAADAGDARAALLVGQTFDPRYLSRIGVFGVRGDPTSAAEWYQRARDLGDSSADVRLQTLKTLMK